MRVLLIEDDVAIRDFLERSLTEAGYSVQVAGTAGEGEANALEGGHDAIILDLGLPDEDGFDLMKRLRQQAVTAPMLILSARRSVDDRVKGLEEGGDDYLTKPFALAELLARLRNILRHGRQNGGEPTRLRVLDLELDLIRRDVTRGSRTLNLTPQEFVLLEYLTRNAGRVVTRSMILDHVWGMRIQPDTNVVDVHIYRLRNKVDSGDEAPLIRTLRGVGYILRDK